MLENPYYSDQPNVPHDAGAYRGEGRIEESPDGTTIVVRWEASLTDGVAAQMRFQEKLGTVKNNRRVVVFVYFAALVCLLYAALLYPTGSKFTFLWVLLGFFVGVIGLLRPLLFRHVVRRTTIRLRGTSGTVDTKLTLDVSGVHNEWENMISTFRWAGVREVEISKQSVIFFREPAMILYVPVRIFPDAATLERFVQLALKYSKL